MSKVITLLKTLDISQSLWHPIIREIYEIGIAVEKIIAQKYDKTRFLEELDREADYCFRTQIEWETFFTTWPPYIGAEEINRIIKEFYLNREQGVPLPERTEVNLETKHRIDVYAQLRANWERFSDYVWKEGQK